MSCNKQDETRIFWMMSEGAGIWWNILEWQRKESDNDNGLVDTEGRDGNMDKAWFNEKMEIYIHIIWNFCNGLKYQAKFQDPQFLRTLGKDGAGFFRLVQNCLSHERWYNLSRAGSPSTWERATSNVMFYRAHPLCNHGTWSTTCSSHGLLPLVI